MRADRLLGLLLTLQLHGRTTAANLAREFGVSLRTIYRDLDALSAAGVPVRAEAGHGGGCELLPAYRSPLSGLNRDEARALVAIGAPRILEELGLAALAGGGRRKLLAGLRADAPQLVHFDPPAWFRPAEPVPCLTALWDACRRGQRLRFSYRGPRALQARILLADPLGLVNKAGLWYVVARGSRGTHAYRVSRINHASPSGEAFSRPENFDLAGYWSGWSARFVADLARTLVTLKAHPDLYQALPEIIGNRAEAAMAGASEPDQRGWRTLQIPFDSLLAAATGCLGMSPAVLVLEPVEVRNLVLRRARETVDLYTRDGGEPAATPADG